MKTPVWELFKDKSDKSVKWVTHGPNPRFAIYHPPSAKDKKGDLVWDKETGLIWPRCANLQGKAMNWLDANTTTRELAIADRIGWRLPTVEELSSLIDKRQSDPALPVGHPFLEVQFGKGVPTYWTSTNNENPSSGAWFVNVASGDAGLASKGSNPEVLGFAWPVRAGRGGASWNW